MRTCSARVFTTMATLLLMLIVFKFAFTMFLSNFKNISVFRKCEVDRKTEILFEDSLEDLKMRIKKELKGGWPFKGHTFIVFFRISYFRSFVS